MKLAYAVAALASILCSCVSSEGPVKNAVTPSIHDDVSLQLLSAQIAEEDKKSVSCKLLANRSGKIQAIKDVCKSMGAQFPDSVTQQDCRTTLGSMWDSVGSMCPQRVEGFPFPIPSPGQIVDKTICFVASQKAIEISASKAICEHTFHRWPIVVPKCEELFRAVWEASTAWCHHVLEKEALMAPEISSEDQTQIACQVAKQRPSKDETTTEVCKSMGKDFTDAAAQQNCRATLGVMWGSVETLCPQNVEGLPFPIPSPGKIMDKVICYVANQKPIEISASKALCESVFHKFQVIVPKCEALFRAIWESTTSWCAHEDTEKKQLSPPLSEGDQTHVACTVAEHRHIKDGATKDVCKSMGKEFPDASAQQDCHIALGVMWDSVEALCPHQTKVQHFPFPIPKIPTPGQILDKSICYIARQKPIEISASRAICETVFHWWKSVQPKCEALFRAAWEGSTAWCRHNQLGADGNKVTPAAVIV